MEKNKIRKIKLFWPWQDNNREDWLRQMSMDGWHFNAIGLGGIASYFQKGEPREYTYRLDFRVENKERLEDYVDFIQDAGWEYIETHSGWQYFRKSTNQEDSVELFTDFDSKVQKYKRLRIMLTLFFPGALLFFLTSLDKYPLWFSITLVSILMPLAFFTSISLIGVTLRIKELEHQD